MWAWLSSHVPVCEHSEELRASADEVHEDSLLLIADDIHSLISRPQACSVCRSEGERFHYVQMNDQDCDWPWETHSCRNTEQTSSPQSKLEKIWNNDSTIKICLFLSSLVIVNNPAVWKIKMIKILIIIYKYKYKLYFL